MCYLLLPSIIIFLFPFPLSYSYPSSTCPACPVSCCLDPDSVALRPCGMGGRMGLALEPGRPGDETNSGAERDESGLRPGSMWSAGKEITRVRSKSTVMYYQELIVKNNIWLLKWCHSSWISEKINGTVDFKDLLEYKTILIRCLHSAMSSVLDRMMRCSIYINIETVMRLESDQISEGILLAVNYSILNFLKHSMLNSQSWLVRRHWLIYYNGNFYNSSGCNSKWIQ